MKKWNDNFSRLIDFWNKHERWPEVKESIHDVSIGQWSAKQRSLFNKGTLSLDKIKKLEGIGFDWESRGTERVKSEYWIDNFKKLKRWKSKKENLLKWPTKLNTEAEKALSVWLSNARLSWRKGKLSEEQINLLESIGCVMWGNEQSWYDSLNGFIYFVNNIERFTVIDTESEDAQRIKTWMSNNKAAIKNGKLSDEKFNLLLNAGFIEFINSNGFSKKKRTEQDLISEVQFILEYKKTA